MKKNKLFVSLICCFFMVIISNQAKTVTLQQDLNGYTGCVDTYVSKEALTKNNANASYLSILMHG